MPSPSIQTSEKKNEPTPKMVKCHHFTMGGQSNMFADVSIFSDLITSVVALFVLPTVDRWSRWVKINDMTFSLSFISFNFDATVYLSLFDLPWLANTQSQRQHHWKCQNEISFDRFIHFIFHHIFLFGSLPSFVSTRQSVSHCFAVRFLKRQETHTSFAFENIRQTFASPAKVLQK